MALLPNLSATAVPLDARWPFALLFDLSRVLEDYAIRALHENASLRRLDRRWLCGNKSVEKIGREGTIGC
jgi:hypothetical protein